MLGLGGLHTINIELTSRCNKSCSFCGHQNTDINHSLEYGDMDFELLEKIARQIPEGTTIQFHRDGEPLLYPRLREALKLFGGGKYVTSITTNGNLLMQRYGALIGNLDSICISVFHGDAEQQEQIDSLRRFIERKGDTSPMVLVKIVGEMDDTPFRIPGVRIIRRLLHVPEMSKDYRKGTPTIPEIGICLDFLGHPSINWKGEFFICNRLDPDDKGYIGNLRNSSLNDIWNSKRRLNWLNLHRLNLRSEIPLCSNCDFWGVPSGN